MSTRHTEEPTFIIPAAVMPEVNAYLTRQGYGPVFSLPLVLGSQPELVKASETLATHYGTSWRMTLADKGIIQRFIASRSGETIEKPLKAALTDRGAKRDIDIVPYKIIIVINSVTRTSCIARMTTKFADAEQRFFKIGLSVTGVAPVTKYIDTWLAGDGFLPLLTNIMDTLPRSEVFISSRDGNDSTVKIAYGDPKYRNSNAATRTVARVWIDRDWTQAEVLKVLNLKTVL